MADIDRWKGQPKATLGPRWTSPWTDKDGPSRKIARNRLWGLVELHPGSTGTVPAENVLAQWLQSHADMMELECQMGPDAYNGNLDDGNPIRKASIRGRPALKS